jgi:hypothetical protein
MRWSERRTAVRFICEMTSTLRATRALPPSLILFSLGVSTRTFNQHTPTDHRYDIYQSRTPGMQNNIQ